MLMNIYNQSVPSQMEIKGGMPGGKSESFQLLSEAISVFGNDESSDSSNEVRAKNISRRLQNISLANPRRIAASSF